MSRRRALIAGGGIGGLASALACAHAGFAVSLFERTAVLSEVGAGIQLGPNATRILLRWGLQKALAEAAATPERLLVRDARSGRELGTLPLGQRVIQRYGAPYLTLHRADLQTLLLDAARATGALNLELAAAVESFSDDDDASTGAVSVRLEGGRTDSGALLIGADGLWSGLRTRLLGDGPPRATGHFAYRALIAQQDSPERLRSDDVTVWLGPRLHVVGYPVRGGNDRALNLVAIVQSERPGEPSDSRLRGWDYATHADELRAALAGCCAALRDLVQAVPAWRRWALCDRPPMDGAQQHARGRVALVGDAAHPMLPYLAQGAGMAIEDAAELERVLGQEAASDDVRAGLARFAVNRWRRNAKLQARAARNGRIFHASGLLARSRDLSMRLLGERLLDQPWLYAA